MKQPFSVVSYILLSVLVLFTGKPTIAEECKVLVVVGMDDERAIVASGNDKIQNIEIIIGAANATILRDRLQKVDTKNIKAVFSFGVAGALDPALKPGDLLVSEQVFSQIGDASNGNVEVSWHIDQNLLMAAYMQAQKVNLNIRKGVFFGTDIEARDQADNVMASFYQATGAHLIDNESHIAAQYASEHGLPFLAIRAVSDSVHNPLPPAALLPLDPEDGSPDGSAIAKSLLLNPLQIPALLRAAFNYKKGLQALRTFHERVGFQKLGPNNDQKCLKGSQLSASF